MINFHKYGFLDCRRLLNYFKGRDFWLCQYNPIWLFIWSDTYKPEISFRHDFCFIRILMPDVGLCYYPPIGTGNLKEAYIDMMEDAKEKGIDFYIAPVPEEMKNTVSKLGEKMYEYPSMNSYIYSSEALSFFNGKEFKTKRNLCTKFEKLHPNVVYKVIKKEDFPAIIEFLATWNQENKDLYNTPFYYKQMNMVKTCMEHLYEFDLHGIILMDEKQIYGFSISSIVENVATLHVSIALSSTPGAREELMQCFARTAMLKARYISLECDLGDEEVRNYNLSYKPLKQDKCFLSFNPSK